MKRPLRLFWVVLAHTWGSPPSWLSRELQGKKAELGMETTKHFSPIHGLVSPIGGKPPLVDELVSKMKDMGSKLQAAKPGVIGAPPPAGAAAELAQKAKELQQSATGLPGPAARNRESDHGIEQVG